jgi:mannose-6-phosphate isomerase
MNPYENPFRLEPLYVEKVWGGDLFPRISETSGPTGEMWLASGLSENPSPVRAGPARTLAEGFRLAGVHIAGRKDAERFETFPLLVKAIDAAERLSLQVHPQGKDEAWYVLKAGPDGEIMCGFKKPLSDEEIREALADGSIRDLVNVIKPGAGSVVSVPAGTVHALGPDIVLIEIQEPLNETYRLFDWGRTGLDGLPRPLQTDKALAAVKKEPRKAGLRDPMSIKTKDFFEELLLLITDKLKIRKIHTQIDWIVKPRGELAVLIGVGGEGSLCYRGETVGDLGMFDTYVVPASSDGAVIVPQACGVEVLIASVPSA